MPDNTASIPLRQRPAQFADLPLHNAPQLAARSLYIHVPFCAHKCHYCDFYSLVDSNDRTTPFARRLARELKALAPFAAPLRTIFIGGGTPTLLPPDAWEIILSRLDSDFTREPGCEFTVECNPETADAALFSMLADRGVNRLSLGAQTFDPALLKTLERTHTPDSLPRALELARNAGIERLSIDLIYAIPGQRLEDWQADLEQALALRVDHLSCYNLTYEPRTALTARLHRGQITPVDEALEIDMFHLASETLARAGFDRYEVSNYARPGQQCRHNLAYWRQEDWLAAGPSASAHVHQHRWKNIPHLDQYLSFDRQGFAPIMDHEPPDSRRALRERIMTGLRLAEGMDLRRLIEQIETHAPGARPHFDATRQQLVDAGWLSPDDSRLCLTPEGVLFADRAASELMLTLL